MSDDNEDIGFDSDGSAEFPLDDEDITYDDDDVVAHNHDKGKQRGAGLVYESLSAGKLGELIAEDISKLAAVIGRDPSTVQIILILSRWNVDRLVDRWMDAPDEVLAAAGEPSADTAHPPLSPLLPPSKRPRLEEFECQICLDIPSERSAHTLRCGHRFCNDCWSAHIEEKVKGEGKVIIPCMESGCKTAVDEVSLRRLVEPAIYDRWRELLRENYVAAHSHLRHCPHPSCTNTVSCTGATSSTLLHEVPTVICGAGHTFCFGCGLDQDHKPVICSLAKLWLKNAREDAGTSQWIRANTRECPKCHGAIEKGGGCNRMVCRHCGFQFCWLCMKDWDVHGYNDSVCSTWKEPDTTEIMTDARRNLDKWLFYFDRFNNHELSSKLDQELFERAKDRIDEVQTDTGMSWIEAQFMKEAVEELTKCRATLKWTYAMAHFMASTNQKHIFEDIQADLEIAVEHLSQLLEEPIDEETVRELRQNTVNKMVYVKQRHEILLRDTAKQLHDGLVEWSVPVE